MSRPPTDSTIETTGGTVAIESEEQFDTIRESASRMLVSFHADWCGPCQEMEEPIAELGAAVTAPVLTVNVESLPQLAARYNVRTIPTFLGFAGGAVSERLVGVQEKPHLRAILEE